MSDVRDHIQRQLDHNTAYNSIEDRRTATRFTPAPLLIAAALLSLADATKLTTPQGRRERDRAQPTPGKP